jgi:hypothetical protein
MKTSVTRPGCSGEPAWPDTNDLERLLTEPEALAQHPRVSRKPARPVVVANHGDRMATGRHVIAAGQQTAK